MASHSAPHSNIFVSSIWSDIGLGLVGVEAGVHGKSAHGLRKVGATRAANNGATVAQLEALFGWRGGGMAALYTENADRARLGKQAAKMLIKNDERTSMPSPEQKVGAEIVKLEQKQ